MARTPLGPSSSARRWVIASIAAQVMPNPRFPVRANVDAAVRKRARHGTADGPAGAVDQGGLVLQHHELLHIRVTAALADADTVTSSNWARPVRGSVGVRTEMSKQSERCDARLAP